MAVSPKPVRNQISFSDLSVTMIAHPVTGKLPVVKEEQAVAKAVRNLILTNRFEKPYEPLYGGNLVARLFDNMDPPSYEIAAIRRDVIDAVRNYEPRVRVQDVRVIPQPDKNTLQLTVIFIVLGTNTRAETTFQVERVR